MHIHDAAAVAAALPFERLIPALRAQFTAGCTVPARHVHELPGMTSLVMPAWTAEHYGIKVINVAPGNAAQGLPGLHAVYVLFDARTGVPLALMDGDELTARRTAATSALAASCLAPADARRLLVVGTGRVARLLPLAYRAVRPIVRCDVWARTRAKADALAAEWREHGIDAHGVADLAEAARRADVVSCATSAGSPLIEGAWLRPGSHLDLIGSFTPHMREADDACFAGAAIYVDTDEALRKSGDLLGPLARGVFTADDVGGTLEALARATAAAPTRRDQRTVFKSVGFALEDLAAAMCVAGSGAATRAPAASPAKP